ncbi:acyltransferase family protein [Desulfuromonas versatilis]|uniref:acyltransferase family protein n=1 Tax=Desulfuromonas versatilis TaxID=2802975 RepID=UPI001C845FDE|nr:acyltransferase [Desulfuromonas versatilis]
MSTSRIPCLDGIRCIAVAFVLLAHCNGTRYFTLPGRLGDLLHVGNLGVRIFFVLSGFLITTLLLQEREKYGQISLKNFYIRRTIRIFPALYFFVACVVTANSFGWIQLSFSDVLHSLTYTMNYHYDRGWEVGHLWSLAVEEQFYLLWPIALIFFGNRRGLWFALGVVVAVPIIRVLTWEFFPSQRPGIGESFQTVCDALATGCLLAGLRHYWGAPKIKDRCIGGVWVPLIAFGVLTLNYFSSYISISYTVGTTLMNFVIALLIDWAIRNPETRTGHVLNSRIFAYLGALSYSLYLWQQPFLNRASESILCAFPLNIILAFAAAIFSYHLVEQPFLGLRTKFRKPEPLGTIKREQVAASEPEPS